MSSRKAITSVLFTLGLIACLHFFTVVHVCGESMLPTLQDNYYGVAVRTSQPQVGDIVIAKTDSSQLIIKRVVGLPGDIVSISEKGTFNNGKEVTPKIHNSAGTPRLEIKVPEDHYFLLGDNRDNSYDSRVFGAVDKRYIDYKLIGTTLVNKYIYVSIKYFIITLLILLLWWDELKERRNKWVEQAEVHREDSHLQVADTIRDLDREDTE